MARLSLEEGQPLFGSSANLTGTGPNFRAADIQARSAAARSWWSTTACRNTTATAAPRP